MATVKVLRDPEEPNEEEGAATSPASSGSVSGGWGANYYVHPSWRKIA
jgi:hypothetical protein